jgi:pimeloyl-ACP methyl ester carboxylesterase
LPAQATIKALAEAVNAEKTRTPAGVVLIGHSMGCRVVVEALSRAPERVVGVILIDGGITGVGGPATSAERTHQAIAKFGAEAFLDRLFADIGGAARSMELRAK